MVATASSTVPAPSRARLGLHPRRAAEARDLGLASVREAGSLEELEAAGRAIGEETLAVA